MPSATDFLPACITEFMNFEITWSPNLASGMISRFSARWRRDINPILRHARARPEHPFHFVMLGLDPSTHFLGPRVVLRPPEDDALTLWLLRPLGAVFGAALAAVLHALGIEHAAQDVIAHAGQVLDAAAADHHHGMFLQIVPLAGD